MTPAAARSERAVISFLAFLGILLAFGIDVALPAFDEMRTGLELDAAGSSISLVVTVYFLGLAAGQLAYGPLSDRFGRLRSLQVGLAIYAIGALGAAVAPSFGFLLGARLIWGLGAAGPAVLRIAIARDLYEGDEMARVVTIVMAVFMIGPIFVPVIGEGLLLLGTWRIVFWAALVLALVASAWAGRFGETLAVEHRRPFELAPTLSAARAVLSHRTTMGYIAAQTFSGAAFFIFLGSSQPIIDQIYGRADRFAAIFGGLGVVMVGVLLVNNRLITRFGARRMALVASLALVPVSVAGVAVALAADGVPSLMLWIVWTGAANALIMSLTPMCSALALEPMGDKAGMASAVLGAITLAGGAVLAALIDRQIDSTITPMTLAYLVFSLLTLGSLAAAGAWSVSDVPKELTRSRS